MNNLKNFSNKKAFTLAETLIMLSIIGVLAAMTMPTLINSIPKRYESMHKKGSFELEHTVSNLVNSEEYYERMDIVDAENHTVTHLHGLQNTYPVNIDGHIAGSNDPDSDLAKQKFCALMALKFNRAAGSEINCTNIAGFDIDGKIPSFISVDGIQWVMPITDFSDGNHLIMFKTSVGRNDGPNCAYVSPENYPYIIPEGVEYSFVKTDREQCSSPDIFIYVITPSGRLYKEEATTDEITPRRNNRPSNTQQADPDSNPDPDPDPDHLKSLKPDLKTDLKPVKLEEEKEQKITPFDKQSKTKSN